MDVKNISIFDYTYELPHERIAYFPLEQRDQSKLLVYERGAISESDYQHLADFLPSSSLLLFNNTKVVEARLLFKKESGGVIEIFCLEPHARYADIVTAMQQKQSVLWMCLIGGASKWKHGLILEKKIPLATGELVLRARYMEKIHDQFSVELSWTPEHLSFAEVLHLAGVMPLPPYIKREASLADAERYQTVYAQQEGSVAAPTAGLHFTDALLGKLTEKGIKKEFVTLHVGAGTFKPVKTTTMEAHEMHAEFIDVKSSTIEEILSHAGKHITVVGTTSLRTLESMYWLGVKVLVQKAQPLTSLSVLQWDPYELDVSEISVEQSLQALLERMRAEKTERLITTTQLLIAPGYSFKLADALVTNFHQPQSTLLLLVAAFIGSDWRKVYEYALNNNFRFLSYGDGCLLKRS